MISKLTKIRSDDRIFNQFQDQVTTTVNDIIDSQIIDSVLLERIELKSGDNNISHKLARKLTGWIIVRMRGSFVQVYDKQDDNDIPDKTLILNSNGACTVDIYVF